MSNIAETSAWKKFFAAFSSYPELWNKQHDGFKDRDRKESALLELLPVYQKIDEDANIATLKQRIHNIKGVFQREVKKVEERPSYIPNLWYYPHLEFLKDQVPHRTKSLAASVKLEDSFLDSSFLVNGGSMPLRSHSADHSTNSSTQQQVFGQREPKGNSMAESTQLKDSEDEELLRETPSKRLKTMSTTLEYDSPDATLKGFPKLNNSAVSLRDDAAVFAEAWAIQFRNMDAKQKLLAKKLVDDIMFKGQIGELTRCTSIADT